MTRLVLATFAVALIALTLQACDGKETTTIIERTVTEPGQETATSATNTTPTSAPSGPRGTLGYSSVGPLAKGDSIERARRLFGPPDRTQRNAGCELDPSAKAQTALTWSLPDGDLIVQFAGPTGLISYRTTSKQLPTQDGIRVGGSFASLRDSAGTALKPLNLGEPSTPQAGFWFIGQSPRARLTFSIAGGRIDSILGGYTAACE